MRLFNVLPVFALSLVLSQTACSSNDDGGASGASGTSGSAGSSGTAGVGGSAGSGGTSGAAGTAGTGGTAGSAGTAGAGGTASATLAAPTIDELMKMGGALHVMWTNHQLDCDTVEGERKSDTDPYTVIFSVPGTVDNKMDAAATANILYTYRLRCKKGDGYSEYSPEVSRNPTL